MAISLTESGAEISRGRGAAKVSIEVSFRELERWAKKNKIDTKRLMKRSYGRACSGLTRKLAAIMQHGGGINGVPRFKAYESITQEMRRARGVDPNGPIGGMLAMRKNIKAWKSGGKQFIGWPDAIGDIAEKFQSGFGERFDSWEDKDFRAHIHRRFGLSDIPRSYVHNKREVIEPHFHGYVKSNLDYWAEHIFYKELARQMQRSGSIGI